MSDIETTETNELIQAHSEGNLSHASFSQSQPESSGDDAGLERERPVPEREEQEPDDVLERRPASKTLDEEEGRAREDLESKQWEKQRNAELAEALDCHPEDIRLDPALRTYSAEELAKACKRYDLSPEDLSDPKTAKLLKGKLDSDLYITKLKSDPDAEEEGEGSTAEEESEETEQPEKEIEQKPVPVPAGKSISELTPEEHESLSKHVNEIAARSLTTNEKAYTEVFQNALTAAMKADVAADPEGISLENTVSVLLYGAQAAMESAQARAEAALPAQFANFINANFADIMSAYFPGLQEMHTDATLYNCWEEVRGDLPAYGTPEFQELVAHLDETAPWVHSVTFNDEKGQPLRGLASLRAKAALAAKVARGDQVSPEHFRAAVAKGKADAERANRRVHAGKALGAGRSRGQLGEEARATSLFDAYSGRHNGGIS